MTARPPRCLLSAGVVLAAFAGALVWPAARANAQATVSGQATDTTGVMLAGVEVSAAGVGARVRTDDHGHFTLAGVPFGDVALVARRLGFRPETLLVAVVPQMPALVAFQLRPLAIALPPVQVRRARRRHTGRLAGFYERMESGSAGYFVTRDKIDLGNPRFLTNVLQRMPGVEIVRGGRVRLRGRNCGPLLFLDGTPMGAGEVDLNTFPPSSIEGIEIYSSASGAPSRYLGTRDDSRCGTILLWSRGADTELRRRPVAIPAEELERRYARREVYTAADVDVPAQPATDPPIVVAYPPELIAERIPGSVIAEIVVDTLGVPVPGTFGVLSSTHPLLSRAVQDGLERARFTAASVKGQRVPQVVQMTFRFDPRSGGG